MRILIFKFADKTPNSHKVAHIFLRKAAIALMISLSWHAAHAQQKVYEVRGTLVDPDGGTIQFANIVNINKTSACISNAEGRFRILMLRDDTIRVSCIGYEITGFAISSLDLDETERVVELGELTLQPRVYELSTVSVYAERWNSFLFDYAQLPAKEEPYYVKTVEKWKENLIDVRELQELQRGSLGVGISFDLGAHRRKKAQQKIAEFERQDKLDKEAADKYNPSVVAGITGMTMEDAEKFVARFRLDRDFILSRNDYDLYIIIKQLYREYSKND